MCNMKLRNRIEESFKTNRFCAVETAAPPAAMGSAGGSPSLAATPAPAPVSPVAAPSVSAASPNAAIAAAGSSSSRPGLFGLPTIPLKKLPDATKTNKTDVTDNISVTDALKGPAGEVLPAPGALAAAAAPAPIALDAPFAQPLMGRFKTPKEAEEGLRRSQDEGIRLYNEVRALKETTTKALADREAQLQSLKAELEVARTTPVYKELTKEELSELAQKDPVAASEYIAEKKFRDRDALARKEQVQREAQMRQQTQAETLRAIEQRDVEMRSNPEEFPQYEEIQPVMAHFAEATKVGKFSPLTGHAWSGEILYLAAMGHSYLQAIKAGKGAQDEAAQAARLKASADAAGSGKPAAGDGTGSGSAVVADPATKEDSEWRKAVLSSQPKPFLGKR